MHTDLCGIYDLSTGLVWVCFSWNIIKYFAYLVLCYLLVYQLLLLLFIYLFVFFYLFIYFVSLVCLYIYI